MTKYPISTPIGILPYLNAVKLTRTVIMVMHSQSLWRR